MNEIEKAKLTKLKHLRDEREELIAKEIELTKEIRELEEEVASGEGEAGSDR